MRFGDTLKNGATVIDFHEGTRIVLAGWLRGPRTEFITWYVDTNGNAELGHYFDSIGVAVHDFDMRIVRLVGE